MKSIRTYLLYAMCIPAALLLAACDHKELCYSHPHGSEVRIVFDWQNAPSANPSCMEVFLFPEGGGRALYYQFTGRNGGKANIPGGKYRVVAFNGDSEVLHYTVSPVSYEDFMLTTNNTSVLSQLSVRAEEPPRASGTEDQRVIYAMDRLWADYVGEVSIPDLEDSHVTVTLYPNDKLCHYDIIIRGVTNLASAQSVSASLSGLSGSYLPGTDSYSGDACTVPFAMGKEGDATLHGTFSAFGYSPGADKYMLSLYVVLADGTGQVYEIDVTDQVRAAADPRQVEILLQELELPKPIASGGGFQLTVSGWGDAIIIELGL